MSRPVRMPNELTGDIGFAKERLFAYCRRSRAKKGQKCPRASRVASSILGRAGGLGRRVASSMVGRALGLGRRVAPSMLGRAGGLGRRLASSTLGRAGGLG